MKNKVYCRTVAKGIQEYYLEVDGKRYYLFEQDYRVSNRDYFKDGVDVNKIGDFRNVRSESVRMTLDKLPKYLKKLDKRYGLGLYKRDVNPYQRVQKHQWLCYEAA